MRAIFYIDLMKHYDLSNDFVCTLCAKLLGRQCFETIQIFDSTNATWPDVFRQVSGNVEERNGCSKRPLYVMNLTRDVIDCGEIQLLPRIQNSMQIPRKRNYVANAGNTMYFTQNTKINANSNWNYMTKYNYYVHHINQQHVNMLKC